MSLELQNSFNIKQIKNKLYQKESNIINKD